MHLAVDVVQHGLDRGGQAGEEQVLGVAAAAADAAAPGCPWRPAMPPTRTASVSGSTEASAPGVPPRRVGVANTGSAAASVGSQPPAAGCGSRRAGAPRSRAAWRHRVDDGRGARVGRPRLRLLLVGEHQRAQAEDLVDLGAVEEVRRALRGELRVVGEDDRRREQQVAAPGRSGEHRPGVLVVQLAGGGQRPLGRVGGREERARADGRAGCARRSATSAGAVSREAPSGQAESLTTSTRSRSTSYGPGSGAAATDDPPGQRQAAPLDVAAGDPLDVVLRRRPRRPRSARGRRGPSRDGEHGVDLPLARPRPRGSAGRRRRPSSSTGRPPWIVDGPGAQVQEAQPHVSTAPGRRRASTSVRRAVRLVGGSRGGVSTPNCQRSRFFCAEAR